MRNKEAPVLAATEHELLTMAADGASYKEMAKQLGVPMTTVRSRIQYARRRFNAANTAHLIAILFRTKQLQ